jgi:hypothetical protein
MESILIQVDKITPIERKCLWMPKQPDQSDQNAKTPKTPYGEYDMEDLPFSVSSSTDCTGLIPTPPPSEDAEKSYQDIYVIPKQQLGNEHHHKGDASHQSRHDGQS